VLEATLLGLRALAELSRRNVLEVRQLDRLGALPRVAVDWGFVALPLLVVVAPVAALVVRDVFRTCYARLPRARVLGAGAAFVAGGLTLSLAYYPALASQVSPKQVFDSYRIYARADEPLATVGVTAGSATYYTGHPVEAFDSATDGFRWLNASTERRFLAVREKDLAQLNSLYRKRRAVRGGEADASIGAGPGNLPVLDARSSEILLVSNQLRAGEVSHNPFADCVLDVRPQASHPMDSNLGGRLEVLGWEITDPDGRLVDTMSPGGSYVFRIYYEVLRPMSSAWETFIHIDGQHRRFNGDHPTLGGRYPARLWRPGDYIADIHPFRLDPNFTPGTYQVFFGLFLGSRRLEVERGPNDDDRLRAGSIQVQ